MTGIGDDIATDRAPPEGGRPLVRAFRPGDAAAVRKLFITVNRLLAPPHLATEFEAYIAGALREEKREIQALERLSGSTVVICEGMTALECCAIDRALRPTRSRAICRCDPAVGNVAVYMRS